MSRQSFSMVLGMLGVLLMAVSANAAFILNGTPQTAPGTYSWTANDMTGWAGLDAAAQSGNMSSSGFMDGNANASNSTTAALAVSSAQVANINNSHNPNPIGVFDLGAVYHIASIEIIDGAGNGYWGVLGAEVRVSATSAAFASATSVGSFNPIINFGQQYKSVDNTYAVGMDVRYILLKVKLQSGSYQYNAKIDEMNIFAVPEPASLALMAAGGLLLASPKRHKHA